MTGPHAYGDHRGKVLGVNSTGDVPAAGGVRDLDLDLAEIGCERQQNRRQQRLVAGGNGDDSGRTRDIITGNWKRIKDDYRIGLAD